MSGSIEIQEIELNLTKEKEVKSLLKEFNETKTVKTTNFDVIVYHSNCTDGKVGRWISERYGEHAPGVQYVALVAGFAISIDIIRDKRIQCIDVMPVNLNDLLLAESVEILDHHETNWEDYEDWRTGHIRLADVDLKLLDKIQFIYSDVKCGGIMAWEYYKGINVAIPWFLQAIDDRDRYVWTFPTSRAICKYLFRNFYHKDNVFDDLMTWTLAQIKTAITEGQKLIDHDAPIIANICKSAMLATVTMDDQQYTCYLAPQSHLVNEVGEALTSRSAKISFAAMWKYDLASDEWWISLRSLPGFHCGRFAKRLRALRSDRISNGSGHPGAAGLTIKGGKLQDIFTIV